MDKPPSDPQFIQTFTHYWAALSAEGQVVACIAALNTSIINNHMNTYKSVSGSRTAKDGGATINSIGMIGAQPVLSNILTDGAAGTLARKVEVYDRDGASQGFMYLYTT